MENSKEKISILPETSEGKVNIGIHKNQDEGNIVSSLDERKTKFFNYIKKDKKWIIWTIFAFIAWFGYYIRTRNIPLLKDVTTGDFIQADPDHS